MKRDEITRLFQNMNESDREEFWIDELRTYIITTK